MHRWIGRNSWKGESGGQSDAGEQTKVHGVRPLVNFSAGWQLVPRKSISRRPRLSEWIGGTTVTCTLSTTENVRAFMAHSAGWGGRLRHQRRFWILTSRGRKHPKLACKLQYGRFCMAFLVR